MRKWTSILLVAMLALTAVAHAHTGNGGVWGQKKGDFVSSEFSGDASGIQSALDYAGTGGTVQLAAGRYQINTTLLLRYPGIRFFGASDSTVLENTAAGAGDTLIKVIADHCTVRGMTLDGRKDIKTLGEGIHVMAKDVTVDDILVLNTPDKGIHIHIGSDRARVQNCRIKGAGGGSSTDGRGITIHGSNDCEATDNYVDGSKSYGIWIQAPCHRTKIVHNIVTNSGDDAIRQDSTNVHDLIQGNTLYNSTFDGIEADGDSTQVSNNVIARCGDFGLWSHNGGAAAGWWGNTISDCNHYAIGIQIDNGTTVAGWAIFSNFLESTAGPNLELQSTGVGSILKDCQVANNYVIKNKPSLSGGVLFSGMRTITTTGGRIDRVNFMGNVVKDSQRDGFEAINQTAGFTTGLVVENNDFIGNARYGIEFGTSSGSGSYGRVTGNLSRGNALADAPSLDPTNWTYEGDVTVGYLRYAGSLGVFEDSLRVGTSTHPADLIVGRDIYAYDDLMLQNNVGSLMWTDNGGTFQRYAWVDSTNTLRIQPRTSAHVDIYKTDGTLGTRFYGTGGMSITGGGTLQLAGVDFLSTSGNDNRVHSRNSSGGVAVRNAANSSDLARVDDGGAATFNGATTVNNKVVVTDSLRINKSVEMGAQATAVDTMALRRGAVFKKDGSTGSIIIQNTGNILEFNGATGSNLIRASDTNGGLRLQTGGSTTRLQINNTGELLAQSAFSWRPGGSIASASTITLLSGNQFFLTGTTTVNTITVPSAFGAGGYVIWLEVTGALTIKDGTGNLKLNGDFVGDGVGDDDMLELYTDGGSWWEIARSIN